MEHKESEGGGRRRDSQPWEDGWQRMTNSSPSCLQVPPPLTWSPGALDEALKVWMIVPGATLIEICTLSLPLAISGAGVSSTAHKADCSRW